MDFRELAVVIWCLIILLFSKSIRKHVLPLLKEGVIIFIATYFVVVIVFLSILVRRINLSYSILWVFTMFSLFTLFPNFKKIINGEKVNNLFDSYYKSTFNRAAIFTIFLSLYTFNIYIEFLIVVPVLILLGFIKGVLEYKSNNDNKGCLRITDLLIAIIGMGIILNYIRLLILNFNEIFSLVFWIEISVSIWGIIMYLPLVYVLPRIFLIDSKIRLYKDWNNLDYLIIYFSYIKYGIKARIRPKITSFEIYNMEVLYKKTHETSVWVYIKDDVYVSILLKDVRTLFYQLRAGKFKDYAKYDNTLHTSNPKIPIYSDEIDMYVSKKKWKIQPTMGVSF